MSFTVNIYYTGKNGSAKEFAREMTESGLVNKIRAEEGNERYEYFFPLDDPETVLLIDRWRDQQALDDHHKSEMMEGDSGTAQKIRPAHARRAIYGTLINALRSR